MNILIVEDEFSIRIGIKTQLRGLNLTCHSNIFDERSVDAAEGRIASIDFLDLAIIDLRLPSPAGFDDDAGFEIIQKLQVAQTRSQKSTPVIILTSRNDNAATRFARSFANVRCYLTKPWAQHELSQAVEKCLSVSCSPDTAEELKGSL